MVSSALALDGSGALVAGLFGGNVAFGSIPLTTTATNAAFVARVGGPALGTAGAAKAAVIGLVPNPATGTTALTLPAAAEARSVQVLDALGRPVRTYALPAHAPTVSLGLTGLAPGLYVVRCGAASGRLVVQ
ncbi:MAG: hypothetical protein JWP58_2654 [Hymenobacter sp.]|nr:hypothetical protein [Hymenobacter sp.]